MSKSFKVIATILIAACIIVILASPQFHLAGYLDQWLIGMVVAILVMISIPISLLQSKQTRSIRPLGILQTGLLYELVAMVVLGMSAALFGGGGDTFLGALLFLIVGLAGISIIGLIAYALFKALHSDRWPVWLQGILVSLPPLYFVALIVQQVLR